MPHYHVHIRHISKKGKEKSTFAINWSEKGVKEMVANPYMKNESFIFCGFPVNRSNIEEINIYESEKGFEELILPRGEPILEASNDYIARCFHRRLVKGVTVCTDRFFALPAKKLGKPIEITTKPLGEKEKVFIVHGRDETQALRLQKYLTKTLKIDAEMFEDFKERSGSNTIIEQLEYIKDNVGYAFVIVTPDDLGCLRENIDKCRTTMLVGRKNISVKSVCEILDNFHTRARQNVVFEHGLFIGALGRDRVCCLLQEDTKEKPSDIDGILYVGFKKSVRETFTEIAEKLKNLA